MTEPTPPKRIGYAERDEAVARLQQHHAEGRLSVEEFEERMAHALQARTEADLRPLFADLPPQAAVAPLTAPNPGPARTGSSPSTPPSGLNLPAGEPGYISWLRIIGWAAVPMGLVAMIVLGTFWVFMASLFIAPGATALAEALARRHKEQQRLLLDPNHRKEIL